MKRRNPWISISDLLSSVVLILLLMFTLAAIAPKYSQDAQREKVMNQISSALMSYEQKGQLKVNQSEGILEFTSVTFPLGSAELDANTDQLVKDIADKLIEYMEEYPRMEVLIEGHTDPSVVSNVVNYGGYYENNIQLSTLRAANVRASLLNYMGNEYARRIGVAGYGDTRLKNTVNPLSAENRRIEIRMLWNGNDDNEERLCTNEKCN